MDPGGGGGGGGVWDGVGWVSERGVALHGVTVVSCGLGHKEPVRMRQCPKLDTTLATRMYLSQVSALNRSTDKAI